MKVCLNTVLTIAFIIIVIFIGFTTYNSITETKPTPTPKTSPSTPAPAPAPQIPPQPDITGTPQLPESTSLVGLTGIIEEIPQSREIITRHYSWEYDGSEWDWDAGIPQMLYDYYRKVPRPPTKNYSIYVTHPSDDALIELLVAKLEKAAEEKDFSSLETIKFVTTFVQSLPYTVDNVTTSYDEYPRYPVETLVDNGGDCEDTSILLASLLHAMGYKTVLIAFPGHIGVGVLGGENIYGTYYKYDGGHYFYIETTGKGWSFGELPEEFEGIGAELYPMIPTPILTHEWKTQGKGIMAETLVTVKNLGSATAHNIYIFAGFDAGGGKLWNVQESKPFILPVNQQITIQLNIRVPLDKHTRFVIQIIHEGFAVDQSFSNWFDT